MVDDSNIKYRQMYFDKDGFIHQETYVFHREMTQEEQEQYDLLVKDANQMNIFDYISQSENDEK